VAAADAILQQPVCWLLVACVLAVTLETHACAQHSGGIAWAGAVAWVALQLTLWALHPWRLGRPAAGCEGISPGRELCSSRYASCQFCCTFFVCAGPYAVLQALHATNPAFISGVLMFKIAFHVQERTHTTHTGGITTQHPRAVPVSNFDSHRVCAPLHVHECVGTPTHTRNRQMSAKQSRKAALQHTTHRGRTAQCSRNQQCVIEQTTTTSA
jgi:hypothetical protein